MHHLQSDTVGIVDRQLQVWRDGQAAVMLACVLSHDAQRSERIDKDLQTWNCIVSVKA